mmetsp:Transcript_177332/g.568579  ORF Transcript_177332/g.568579 Transcript_177332/m.568579 type:complete len:224 (+) Transcript_177332:1008-1679(+)
MGHILQQPPRHIVHRIEAKPVHAVLFDPGPARLLEVVLHFCLVEGEALAPRCVFLSLEVDAAAIVWAITVPIPKNVLFCCAMVEHHIEEHGNAQTVGPMYEVPQIRRWAPRAVRRKLLPRVVSPNAAELCRRHELYAIETQCSDVLELLGGKSKGIGLAIARCEAAEMQLVHHQLIELGPLEGLKCPHGGMQNAPRGVEVRFPCTRVPAQQPRALLLEAVVPR